MTCDCNRNRVSREPVEPERRENDYLRENTSGQRVYTIAYGSVGASKLRSF